MPRKCQIDDCQRDALYPINAPKCCASHHIWHLSQQRTDDLRARELEYARQLAAAATQWWEQMSGDVSKKP